MTILNPLQKAQKNPKSLRRAVNAKCYDCEGGDADPGVKKRIGTCTVKTCPLNPVRPYQRYSSGNIEEDNLVSNKLTGGKRHLRIKRKVSENA